MGARLLLAAVAWETWPVAAAQGQDDGVESAWLYGNMNKYAYYFADLMIGSPVPQRASVIVDTGSHLVGLPCRGCEHCGNHLDPAFDVNKSKSARWLPCGSGCKHCMHGHCTYSETYSEGSSISGFWLEDSVELGDSVGRNPPVRALFGCHRSENRLFYTQRANGIMGLAPNYAGPGSASAAPTFLEHLFRDRKHVDSEMFSLCLGTWGGKLTVGGYDSSRHVHSRMVARRHCTRSAPCEDDGTMWIGLHTSQYYFVFPQGVQVDGVMVPIGAPSSFGSTIIDSGTTYTYFPPLVYRALSSQLKSYCGLHGGCGADIVDRSADDDGSVCWRLRLPGLGPVSFPTIQLAFMDGVKVDWAADGYLHERGQPGTWCETFVENSIDQTVLGISWMLHKDVIFDISAGRLGVAQASCPEHRQQPEPGAEAVASLYSAEPLDKEVERTRRSSLAPLAALALVALIVPSAAVIRLGGQAGGISWRGRPQLQRPQSEERGPCIERT